MTCPAKRATVRIYRMYKSAPDQGEHVATVVVDDYKHAGGNARDAFVRDCKPDSGRYVCVSDEYGKELSRCLVFEVKRADYVVTTNGVDRTFGGDFPQGSSYSLGSNPEWQFVNTAKP